MPDVQVFIVGDATVTARDSRSTIVMVKDPSVLVAALKNTGIEARGKAVKEIKVQAVKERKAKKEKEEKEKKEKGGKG